jgi:uncharacterized protein (DUF305 family)
MRLPVTLAVLATTALLATGCGTAPEATTPAPAAADTAAVGTATGGTFNETDVMFLQMIGPHHTQGIALVKLAAERSARDEVKTLAKAIEVTQTDELTRIGGWLKEWKQPATASDDAHAAHGGQPGTSEKEIAKLRELTGAAFDTEFLNTLIAHQDDAVQLARMETTGGSNVNTKAFAKQIDQSRTAQLQQMLGYLKK